VPNQLRIARLNALTLAGQPFMRNLACLGGGVSAYALQALTQFLSLGLGAPFARSGLATVPARPIIFKFNQLSLVQAMSNTKLGLLGGGASCAELLPAGFTLPTQSVLLGGYYSTGKL
jgi:hypothetical protein